MADAQLAHISKIARESKEREHAKGLVRAPTGQRESSDGIVHRPDLATAEATVVPLEREENAPGEVVGQLGSSGGRGRGLLEHACNGCIKAPGVQFRDRKILGT